MNMLLGRIVEDLHKDLMGSTGLGNIVEWEASDSEDEDGIEFRAVTNEDRGLILYRDGSDFALGLEAVAGGGTDEEIHSDNYPLLAKMYNHLLAQNFNVDAMEVDELIDFYFKTGD